VLLSLRAIRASWFAIGSSLSLRIGLRHRSGRRHALRASLCSVKPKWVSYGHLVASSNVKAEPAFYSATFLDDPELRAVLAASLLTLPRSLLRSAPLCARSVRTDRRAAPMCTPCHRVLAHSTQPSSYIAR
jgi:hypothetical protein